MIRPYRTIPRFDDGFNFDYNAALLNALNYGAPTQTVAPTPGYEFLEPPVSQYVREEPEIPDMEEPAFMRMTANNVLSKPKLKRTTTAAQDYKSAERTYRGAMNKADAKAREEARKAEAEQRRLAVEAERNRKLISQRKAELDKLKARSAYWKAKQSVQKSESNKKSIKNGFQRASYNINNVTSSLKIEY